MKSSVVLALAAISQASPLVKRGYTPPRPAGLYLDSQILNYALTLEHLEATFYRQGLAQYTADDFVAAGFTADQYAKFETIAKDEATHVDFLTGALAAAGKPAVAECTYNFPYTDVASFIGLASVLEGVGVTAYLGAAAKIASKTYLTAAGSILTVEARHNAYIRNALAEEPFAQPFDVPNTPNSVFTLAGSFITSCPASNPKLPLKAYPAITASSGDSPIVTGSVLTLTTTYTTTRTAYAAFITVTGPIFQVATPVTGGFQVTVPAGVNGQSYVVLTWTKTAANDNTIRAGPAIVEIAGTA